MVVLEGNWERKGRGKETTCTPPPASPCRRDLGTANKSSGLSTSCPEQWQPAEAERVSASRSLPGRLEAAVVFGREEEGGGASGRQDQSRAAGRSTGRRKHVQMAAPRPPPPPRTSPGSSARTSPVFGDRAGAGAGAGIRRNLRDAGNLVHIKVLNVDPRAPDFGSKYNRTNR